jgi:DNA polymerase elongation subunit (family B)
MMNAAAAVFFKTLCGQRSEGKILPSFIFNVPEKYQRILLEKMIEGDGSHSVNKKLGYSKEYVAKNFAYTTKSLGVASGLTFLLNLLGITHSIQYRPAKKCYTIKTSTAHNKRIKTKIVEEPYSGYVYDLTVEENNNFVDSCGQVLLHNTDSAFILLPGKKTEEDVKKFVQKVNTKLPGRMELEFEGLYKRGIFVTKKEGHAAKKRYALADYENNLTIVGFEYVRRDVSVIARETQKKVLEEILVKGNPKKAHDIVLEAIKRLRAGKVPKKELVILTQLQRKPESYAAMAPHVSAAQKAQKRGKEIPVGSMLGFIITKNGKSISDKAELEEFVKEGDYDADYYIKNQVIPAVEKIFAELGIDSTDLERGGKQTGLSSFM